MTKRILILLGGVALLVLAASTTTATEDLAEALEMKCTACHDKAGSKLLTSKGKYFELRRSFDGFDDLMRKYRKCTKCHASFPGSQKLTKRGERLKAAGVTMDHVITDQPVELEKATKP
ncbi:MAG: hypothetical protein GY716_17900 [bacterium]|nr:hypothetical protein [bacterium]